MNPIQPLSDDELDELDDLLMSRNMPENTMDISMLDGFFAGLVLNPRTIMPSEFLRWIWDSEEGKEEPGFSSLTAANHVLGLIMRHYNMVVQSIADDSYEPLFYLLSQDDGSDFFDAEGWSCGFILATDVFNEPWETLFEERPELVTPMVLLGTEKGWDMLEQSGDNKRATQEAYEAIADSVSMIYDYFGDQREAAAQQRLSQTGMMQQVDIVDIRSAEVMDDTCPCGSGKEFGKCCGTARTLH